MKYLSPVLDFLRNWYFEIALVAMLGLATGPSLIAHNGHGVVLGIIAWGVLVVGVCLATTKWR